MYSSLHMSDPCKIQDRLITGWCRQMLSKATVPNLTLSNAREIPESLRRSRGCRGKGDSLLETKRYAGKQSVQPL